MDNKKIDMVKEIVWNLLVYVLYTVYCFVMLLLFHMITYSIFNLDWTMKTIIVMAAIASTIMMVVRIVKRVKK